MTDLPEWTLAEGADPGRIKVLALLLDDPNPLHYDPAAARSAGYTGLLNQGPANLAMLANLLLAAFPGGRVRRLSARFGGAVVAGAPLRATGRITAVDDQDGARLVTCEVRLESAGTAVLTGEGVVVCKPVEENSCVTR
ncbi:MaoC family dehydratase [Actinophytocola oryzae]|uniref:Acyl dehydratase n=1 Tax=Actinophytocola oryzae TaxID=502181 RepID=A0A4R7W292_9PSEU|nr:MaoC family dehydratase [Actinophytocola oryzae]TDV56235.1 acyl dehydratase [Actinophytocola oryzae]